MKIKEQLRTYVDLNPNVMEIFKLKRIGDKIFILKPRKNTFLTFLLGFIKEEIDKDKIVKTHEIFLDEIYPNSEKIIEYELVSQRGIIVQVLSLQDLHKTK